MHWIRSKQKNYWSISRDLPPALEKVLNIKISNAKARNQSLARRVRNMRLRARRVKDWFFMLEQEAIQEFKEHVQEKLSEDLDARVWSEEKPKQELWKELWRRLPSWHKGA